MKGAIFNLFEGFVNLVGDEDTYDKLLDEVGSELETREPFVGPGTYPDSDFFLLLQKALEMFELPLNTAVHAFGKYCFPRLVTRLPSCLEGHAHPKTFLLTIDDVIHVEVKKVYRSAEPPQFTFRDPGENKLVMIYRSKRGLIDFVEEMLEGVSEHFNVPIQCERHIIHQGDYTECEFHLQFG